MTDQKIAEAREALKQLDGAFDRWIDEDKNQRRKLRDEVFSQVHSFADWQDVARECIQQIGSAKEVDMEWKDLILRKTFDLLIETSTDEAIKDVSKQMIEFLCDDLSESEDVLLELIPAKSS